MEATPPEGPRPKWRVFIHPAPGTYNRLPLAPEGQDRFSYKVVRAVSSEDEPGEIVFIDPKSRRDARASGAPPF